MRLHVIIAAGMYNCMDDDITVYAFTHVMVTYCTHAHVNNILQSVALGSIARILYGISLLL